MHSMMKLLKALYDNGEGEIPYEQFEGIVLTDTFQLGETDDSEKLFSEMFPQNSKRVQRQKKALLELLLESSLFNRPKEGE
jgi:predicted helicase